MKKIIEALCINEAICESPESDRIVRFLKDEDLSIALIEAIQNGDVWGIYYNDDEELVYQDNGGEEFVIESEELVLSEDGNVLFNLSKGNIIENAYLIVADSIRQLELEENTASDDSSILYYTSKKDCSPVVSGTLIIQRNNDGSLNAEKSKWDIMSDSFDEYKTKISTLTEFCEYLNGCDEFPLEAYSIIEENGWEDLTGEDRNVCSDGEYLIRMMDNGSFDIISVGDK